MYSLNKKRNYFMFFFVLVALIVGSITSLSASSNNIYQSLVNRGWATTVTPTPGIVANLTGAAVVFINYEKKLQKVSVDQVRTNVFDTNPDCEQIEFDASGNLYVVFSEKQSVAVSAQSNPYQIQTTENFILVKINPNTNAVTGIDKDLIEMVWNRNSVSPNIQFDGSGNLYYLAKNNEGNVVLRKYVSSSDITDYINENISVYHWLTRTDGTVIIGGQTISSEYDWLRKVSTDGSTSYLATYATTGWILDFPDNQAYAGIVDSAPNEGVYKMSEDLSPMNDAASKAPWIGFAAKETTPGVNYTPDYDVADLVDGKNATYCRGLTDTGGATLLSYGLAGPDKDKILGLTGAGQYRTILYFYPTPQVLSVDLLTRVTLMVESLGELVISGIGIDPFTEDPKNKLILKNLTTGTEIDITYQDMEIYNLDVLSTGSILFDALRFSDNTHVIGMFERAAGSAKGDVSILDGYKELAELGGKADAFTIMNQTESTLSVAISSPTHGAEVSGTVDITSTVTADNDVTKVEFFVDGVLKGTDTATPFQYSWNTIGYTNGYHTLKAKVTDSTAATAEDQISVNVINVITNPTISLTRNRFYFGATTRGDKTPNQNFLISNAGPGTLNWSVSDDAGWLTCNPTSGTETGKITISIDPSGLSASGLTAETYIGTISVTATATNSPQTVTVTLTVKDPTDTSLPFGSFDTPIDGTSGITGAVPVTGWILDDIGVDTVKIYRDQVAGESSADVEDGLVYIGDAGFVEGARRDVEGIYSDYPLNTTAGWGYMMLTNFLPNQGNGTYVLHAYATDQDGHEVSLGTKTITCDNISAVKPFGTIDTPTQGGTISGLSWNAGWALTPQTCMIPTDGSTLWVWINGVRQEGHPDYNQYRVDIATLFPGLKNTDGAVGAYLLDTSLWDNGVHTIAWSVKDDCDRSDGLGSRFFSILNEGADAQTQTIGKRIRRDSPKQPTFDSMNELPVNFRPLRFKRGLNKNAASQEALPNEYGQTVIEINEVERVEVDLGEGSGYNGYEVVGTQLRPLPIGSTLDAEEGVFYWQPGPGFLGKYELVFFQTNEFGMKKKISVQVRIIPKINY